MPNPQAFEFFLAELTAGRLNINSIAIAILDGAQGPDLTLLNAKIEAADLFTSRLDLESEQNAYVGDDAAQVGRDYLHTVSLDDRATPSEADAAILSLLPECPGMDTILLEPVSHVLSFTSPPTGYRIAIAPRLWLTYG